MEAPAARPLRADAARNAERIITAAWTAFTESGTDVSLEEIARRAGVGVATLYRRFPNKDELITAVVRWRYDVAIEPVLRDAMADPDPWRGMVATFEATLQVAQQDLMMVKASRDPARLLNGVLSQLVPELASVVRRGQEGGVVREDLREDDLGPLIYMLVSVVRITGDWRRYLGLVLDGLRPGVGSLPGSLPGWSSGSLPG